jgi:hypothetical protein
VLLTFNCGEKTDTQLEKEFTVYPMYFSYRSELQYDSKIIEVFIRTLFCHVCGNKHIYFYVYVHEDEVSCSSNQLVHMSEQSVEVCYAK